MAPVQLLWGVWVELLLMLGLVGSSERTEGKTGVAVCDCWVLFKLFCLWLFKYYDFTEGFNCFSNLTCSLVTAGVKGGLDQSLIQVVCDSLISWRSSQCGDWTKYKGPYQFILDNNIASLLAANPWHRKHFKKRIEMFDSSFFDTQQTVLISILLNSPSRLQLLR